MLSIKETQMRQADAVFEKEQEYLLGAAFEPSPKPQKEKLYVNEYGYVMLFYCSTTGNLTVCE
jgi:mediator of replication checkpoint protein 1